MTRRRPRGSTNGPGLFCAWGAYSAPIVGIQTIDATSTGGSGQTLWQTGTNGIWAAVIRGGLSAGAGVTLTVTAMSQPSPTQPPVQVQESITFTFLGPSPQALLPAGTTGS
jgi:hypothetical protein